MEKGLLGSPPPEAPVGERNSARGDTGSEATLSGLPFVSTSDVIDLGTELDVTIIGRPEHLSARPVGVVPEDLEPRPKPLNRLRNLPSLDSVR